MIDYYEIDIFAIMTNNKISVHDLIIKVIQKTPTADNIQPWLILTQDLGLIIKYDAKKKGHLMPPKHASSLLSLGSLIENLEQINLAFPKLIKIKINNEYEFDQNQTYAEVSWSPNQSGISDEILNHNIFKRTTDRSIYKKEKLFDLNETELMNIVTTDAQCKLIESKNEVQAIARQIGKASEVRFQIKECHDWLMDSLRFRQPKENQDGLWVEKLKIPYFAILFLRMTQSWRCMQILNVFGAYKLMALFEKIKAEQSSSYIVFGSDMDYLAVINCGKAMQRTWLVLTEKHISVHPYFVLTDMNDRLVKKTLTHSQANQIKGIRTKLAEIFCLKNSIESQIIFRIGRT